MKGCSLKANSANKKQDTFRAFKERNKTEMNIFTKNGRKQRELKINSIEERIKYSGKHRKRNKINK